MAIPLNTNTDSVNRACDACEDWYHGDCIGISQKEAKFIKQYFCDVSMAAKSFTNNSIRVLFTTIANPYRGVALKILH